MHRRLSWSVKCFLLLWFVVSCASTPEGVKGYLQNAVQQATQDDVLAQLGPPHFTKDLTDGTTVWLYQYCTQSVNHQARPPCIRYHLIFNSAKRLEDWKEQEF